MVDIFDDTRPSYSTALLIHITMRQRLLLYEAGLVTTYYLDKLHDDVNLYTVSFGTIAWNILLGNGNAPHKPIVIAALNAWWLGYTHERSFEVLYSTFLSIQSAIRLIDGKMLDSKIRACREEIIFRVVFILLHSIHPYPMDEYGDRYQSIINDLIEQWKQDTSYMTGGKHTYLYADNYLLTPGPRLASQLNSNTIIFHTEGDVYLNGERISLSKTQLAE